MQGYINSDKAARAISAALKMVEAKRQQCQELNQAAAEFVQVHGQRLRVFSADIRSALAREPFQDTEIAAAMAVVLDFMENEAMELESTALEMMTPHGMA